MSEILQDRGVYHKSVRSGTWYLMNIAGQKAINIVSFFVLARLLVPRDYGVIGVAMLVAGLADTITDFSFGDALTREKGDIEPYLDPYWTYELLRRLLLAVLIFFGAGAIGAFFHFQAPEIAMLRWSGVLTVLLSLGNVRQLYFFKELQFEKVFLRDVLTQAAFAAGAICFALFVQASAWALFVGYFVSYLVSLVMTYVLYPSRPVLSFRFGRLKKLVHYSKWVYGQSLLDAFMAQADRLIVGRLIDPASLGLYSKGKDLASTTTSIMASIISKVGFSAFSKVQDQMDKVRAGFLKSIDVLLIGGLPFTILLMLEGGSIVMILLGQTWIGLVVPLKIFAFGNLFLAFVRIVNPVLAALGRPDVNFKTNALQTILSIPLMFIGYTFYGMNGLAAAVVVTWIVLLVYVMLKARPVLNIAVRAFVPAIVSGSVASLGVLLVDVIGRSYVHAHEATPLVVAWIGGLSILYFALLAFVSRRFPRGPWDTLVSIWESLFARKAQIH